MAKMKITMLGKDFALKLSKLGRNTDEITAKALRAGAEVALKEARSRLKSVIGNNVKVKNRKDGEPSGELLRSLGISPVDIDKNGVHNIKVGFDEPRRKQYKAKRKRSYYEITNAMIANVLEHGKSGQPAKPFMGPAKRAAKKPAIEAMQRTIDEEVRKL